MSSVPNATKGRLINRDKGAFWEWKIKGKELTTVSGKEGANGKKTTKTHPSPDKAGKDLESKHYKKMKEGFKLYAQDNPGPTVFQTWLTSEYTGFAAFDFDPQQNRIAACRHTGHGGESCEIVFFDAATGDTTQTIELELCDLSKLRFYQGGLIAQSDDRVMRIDPDTGQTDTLGEEGVFPNLVFDLQQDLLMFSRSSKKDTVIAVLDLKTGKTLLEVNANEDHDVPIHRVAYACALSPKGAAAALCQKAGEIELYNLKDGKRQLITGDFSFAAKIQFDRAGKWLGLIEEYGEWGFRLWEIAGKNKKPRAMPAADLSSGNCFDFAFDPTSPSLAVREGDWLHLYELGTHQLKTRIQLRHVVRTFGAGGFHLVYAEDGRVLTRTDRGVLALIDPTRS